jgi:hypothetical protein
MRLIQSVFRDRWWTDAALLFLAGILLVFPLFRIEYLNNWRSIEATFIADARLYAENWPRHQWQPLWYAGTRVDYVYPPGLRCGVALLAALANLSHARAYHTLIAFIYALGIAAVYLWTRTATGRRGAAWLAALGVALLSPSFLLMPDIRRDSAFLVPWRLHVLVTYGEGPHISALAFLPIAWLCAWRRFQGGRPVWIALAACSAALTVSFNFYGATALAITFSLLAWACFVRKLDWRVARDAAAIAALAYGLSAWWLVPSYLLITGRNLRMVAPAGNAWSLPALGGILVLYAGLSFAVRRRREYSEYAFFIWSGLAFLAIYILGFRWFGFQVAGNSLRLIPEMDVFAVLCGAAVAARLWSVRLKRGPQTALRTAVLLAVLISFRPAWRYAKHAYAEFTEDRNWRDGLQFRTAEWLHQRYPDSRVFVTGTIRFWYNVWRDGLQMDGGSQQGVLNRLFPTAQWRVVHDPDAELTRWWLQAFGVDIVVVPGAGSAEPYLDYANAPMYEMNYPLLRNDNAGNRYYRVPRRAPGIVRIVDWSRVQGLAPVPDDSEKSALRAYVEAIEAAPPGGASPGRIASRWAGSDELDIQADLADGEAVLIQQTFDPYWRAYVDGKPQPLRADAAGFLLVHPAPGRHSIRVVFETPLETTAGRIAAVLCVAAAALLMLSSRPGLRAGVLRSQ